MRKNLFLLLCALAACALLPRNQPECPVDGRILVVSRNGDRIEVWADGLCDVQPHFGMPFVRRIGRRQVERLFLELARNVPTGEALPLERDTCYSCNGRWHYEFFDGTHTWRGDFNSTNMTRAQTRFRAAVLKELKPVFDQADCGEP